MSRKIDDLTHSLRKPTRDILRDCKEAGYEMVVFQTFRSLDDQAKLWRMTRGKITIAEKCAELKASGAGYLAEVIRRVGAQYPPSGVRGHVTRVIPGLSWHQYREAFDCYLKVDGTVNWDSNHDGYQYYGEVAKSHGLTWGGDWTTIVDAAHCQFQKDRVIEMFGSMAAVSQYWDTMQ